VIAQGEDDPWMEAWRQLKTFIRSGATEQEVTDYARELGQALPDARDPVAYAQQAEAVHQVVREILN
jgi:hypothetical protein